VRGLWFGLIACFALLPLQAAEIVVAGRAIDENDAGVAGVEVTVRNPAGDRAARHHGPYRRIQVRLPAEGQYFFAATRPDIFR
jgi:hypothetical protein